MRLTSTCRFQLRLAALLIAGMYFGADAASPKFYPDDPIWTVADSQDASGVANRGIDLLYDTLENSFAWPGDRTPNVRAQNLNSVDEVPDSNWFTNRVGARAISASDVLIGPNTGARPAAGNWTVIAAKSDGVTPGFTVRDSAGQIWFLKFDPPGYPAMATGTEVVVTKLLWALGYYVPENHIATLRLDDLLIDDRARITPPSGRERQFKKADIQALLRKAHRNDDGSYRVIASKALEGRPVGGFRFYGVRSDDPNDLVPHEHRRELRAYGVFSAWLNHVDSKSINTLDTVIERNGMKAVRHYLLDFGSTVGSAGVYPREAYEGSEYLVDGGNTLRGIASFGFFIRDWRTVPIYRARSVGAFRLDNSRWDPESWRPRYANSAFRAARPDDKFWAALRLKAFTDEALRAVTHVGQFNDPRSEEMLARFLIDRRTAILRRYLPAVNPIVDVRLSEQGALTFNNAAVDADIASVPAAYVVRWRRFDNATGEATDLGTSSAATAPVLAPADLPTTPGTYILAELSAEGGAESWSAPAHAYFLRETAGWKLVGFERVPAGNPPGTGANRRRTN